MYVLSLVMPPSRVSLVGTAVAMQGRGIEPAVLQGYDAAWSVIAAWPGVDTVVDSIPSAASRPSAAARFREVCRAIGRDPIMDTSIYL